MLFENYPFRMPFEFLLAFLVVFFVPQTMGSAQAIFIRVNQLGFLPQDAKSCVIFASRDLRGAQIHVINSTTGRIAYSSTLASSATEYGNYPCHYKIDFSPVREPGKYFIQVGEHNSHEFSIGAYAYNGIVDSLLLFFQAQRCGFTAPILHAECHAYDATSLIVAENVVNEKIDATGGWHDAGDYTKFLNTTAYVTYTLLFAYVFDSLKFGLDHNHNDLPDVVEEALIGLEWLLKLNRTRNQFITQIQDTRDHEQGWRLPEHDKLTHDRPAFIGMGKNLVGIYAATMAIAYRAWKDQPRYHHLAEKCLAVAERVYSIHNQVPALDTSGTGAYRDSRYAGKMALGAVELYLATGKEHYLKEAKIFAEAAGADYWWSWGDINAYAHYHLAKIDPHFKKYLHANLKYFKDNVKKHVFGEALRDSWGSNTAILGAALQAILWEDLTGEKTFDDLAIAQRDFILGKNPWGISFVYNIGTNFARYFHSQIAFLNGGRLPGAVAAGAISGRKLREYGIHYEKDDPYLSFQTEAATYRDDRMDYVTNEPTITANATAIFVMGFFSNRK